MSSLSVKLLEIANEFESRHQIEIQQYKQEINKLHLENIKLKNEVEEQRYRIEDLMEHSQNLATNLAEQTRTQNSTHEALVQELVASQFELRELFDLRAEQEKKKIGNSSTKQSGEVDENLDPNNKKKGEETKAAKDARQVTGTAPYYSTKDLFDAAGAGDTELVQRILQPKFVLTVSKRATENPSTVEGVENESPSFFASILGQALGKACEFGHGEVSHALLELGADVCATDPADDKQHDSLHKAAASGSADLVKMLLARHPSGIDSTDKGPNGDTLLHIAARLDHTDCVEMLMLAGCDVTRPNKLGVTAEEMLVASAAAQDVQSEIDTKADEDDSGEETNQHPRKLKPFARSLSLLRDTQLQFWNNCAFGNRKYQESDFGRAFEVFTKAIELSEKSDANIQINAKDAATIRYNCARAALHMESYVVAIEFCDKSTEFLSDFLKAWKLRGECYMHLCDYANAISSFKNALAIAPRDTKANQHLARAQELNSQTHYTLLQVKASASDKEIKKAYRKMCLQWHPDKHSQSKDAQHRASCVFKSIQEAYEELSEPVKRIMYDMELRRKGVYGDQTAPPQKDDDKETPHRSQQSNQESASGRHRYTSATGSNAAYARNRDAEEAWDNGSSREHFRPQRAPVDFGEEDLSFDRDDDDLDSVDEWAHPLEVDPAYDQYEDDYAFRRNRNKHGQGSGRSDNDYSRYRYQESEQRPRSEHDHHEQFDTDFQYE